MTEILTTSTADYFEEAIETAIRRQGVKPTEQTSSYLVDLLCAYVRCSLAELSEPLGPAMARAEHLTQPERRIPELKRVGDQSLYVAGFFPQSVRRQRLDLDYYHTLGGTAYRRLSKLVQKQGESERATAKMYRELSEDFEAFVEVLSEVRLDGEDLDIGDLYQRWLSSADKTVERRLVRAGVQLHVGSTKVSN